MTHRNVEIWRKRHERLENARDQNLSDFKMAKRGAIGGDAVRISQAQRRWLERWIRVERRVWHALCVAEGWRKA